MTNKDYVYEPTEKSNQLDLIIKKLKAFVEMYGVDDLLLYQVTQILQGGKRI